MMHQMFTMDQAFYQLEFLALRIGVSPAYLRKEIKEGNLRATKVGRKIIIMHSDFINYINENSNRPYPPEATKGWR